MLILAGVSINAIIGDDGIISRTMYSTFLSEMTAVEEAVQVWKAGEALGQMGEETKTVPAKGLCQVSDLTKTERLVGEVGYYRIWSMTEKEPTTSIFSNSDEFNSEFESEMIFFPAGVQDLFYLNNEVLGIESDKTYIIDIATGMIYSIDGIKLKGVSCYSSNMATAIMSGNLNAPIFAESEVSGTGTDEKLAGNVQDEYLDNGEINPDYDESKVNKYGFKIMASGSNVYKLYNNGDLYAKGIKSNILNTPINEMEAIDPYRFVEIDINKLFPKISGYKKVIQGYGTLYIIDNNNELWAIGDNTGNKLGLTIDEQTQYTGRESVKLNVGGKKVENVYAYSGNTYVKTTDNELWSAGYNSKGECLLSHTSSVTVFEKTILNQEQVSRLSRIYCYSSQTDGMAILKFGEGNVQEFYMIGNDKFNAFGLGGARTYASLTRIWDGITGKDIDQDIKEIGSNNCAAYILLNNGCVYNGGYTWYDGGAGGMSFTGGNWNNFRKLDLSLFNISSEAEENVQQVYYADGAYMIRTNNVGKKEYYAAGNSGSQMGCQTEILTSKFEKQTFPEEMFANGDDIKEVVPILYGVYYIMNSGKVWASGAPEILGKGNQDLSKATSIVCITKSNDNSMSLPLIETAFNFMPNTNATINMHRCILLKGYDGKIYMTTNPSIMFGDKILQKSWRKINPQENGEDIKIKHFSPGIMIDENKNLWVCGNDSRYLGLGENEARVLNNYEKVTDPNVAGKVKQACISICTFSVLTTDGKLFVCGDYSNQAVYGQKCFPGWSASEGSSYSLKEIKNIDNVQWLVASEVGKIALTKKDDKTKIYICGRAIYWQDERVSDTFIEITDLEASEIKKLVPIYLGSFAIMNNGDLYASGWEGIGMSTTNKFMEHPSFSSIKVKDVVIGSANNRLVLTEEGDLYGWGTLSNLGKGNNAGSVTTAIKLDISDVEQIAAGNDFCIAVKKDGTVWGTGSNTYGILGRWIGIDRKQPNSRYKTAFEWVECPELEL